MKRSHFQFFWSWPFFSGETKEEAHFYGVAESGLLVQTCGNGIDTRAIFHEGFDIFNAPKYYSNHASIQGLPPVFKKLKNQEIESKISLQDFGEFKKEFSEVFLSLAIKHVEETNEALSKLQCFPLRGEMLGQQVIYSQFFFAMLAVVDASNHTYRYITDQELMGWYSINIDYKCKRSASIKPDAAVLSQNNHVLAILEIKNESTIGVDGVDLTKVIICTAFTAISLLNANVEPDNIVVPFLTGQGFQVQLYAMCFCKDNKTNKSHLTVYKICDGFLTSQPYSRKVFYNFVTLLGSLKKYFPKVGPPGRLPGQNATYNHFKSRKRPRV